MKIAQEALFVHNILKSEIPMSFVSLRQMLDHAAEFGYRIPAFNVNNLKQVQAIMEAAQATNSLVVL